MTNSYCEKISRSTSMWTRGDTCYTLVEEVQNQAQAQTNCVEMYKGNLVSITSQDEDDFIRARYLDHFRNITAFVSIIYLVLLKLSMEILLKSLTSFQSSLIICPSLSIYNQHYCKKLKVFTFHILDLGSK